MPKIKIDEDGRKAARGPTDLQGASGGSFLLPCVTSRSDNLRTYTYVYVGALRIPPDVHNGSAIESM